MYKNYLFTGYDIYGQKTFGWFDSEEELIEYVKIREIKVVDAIKLESCEELIFE